MTINKQRMAELLAAVKAKKSVPAPAPATAPVPPPPSIHKLHPEDSMIAKTGGFTTPAPAPIPEPPPSTTKTTGGIDIAALKARLAEKAAKKATAERASFKSSEQRWTERAEKIANIPPLIMVDEKETEEFKEQVDKLEKLKEVSTSAVHTSIDGSTVIEYNAEQQQFVDTVTTGESAVLIGAAGSGKTTCTQGAVSSLIQTGKVPVLQSEDHKHLISGSPGILIVAYTRRAVNNIKKVLPADLKKNCITIHKLLEYQPVYYEVDDPVTGETKKTMSFEPTRNNTNPLPSTIHTIVIEESSMVSVELHQLMLNALPHKVQFIYIGDIQQLPPVFGSAILGFKMLELPVIELTQIYRQALESPIIRLAHRILSGKPIPAKEYKEWNVPNKLTIHPWKKKIHPDLAVMTLDKFFIAAIENNAYSPEEDMILIPFNKACGTIELNKHIANYLARKRGETTYEVMAGFNKHYFSVGDKVLYDKEDAEIIEISYNNSYTGAKVQPESKHLDYWGHNPNLKNERFTSHGTMSEQDIELLLNAVASEEDRVTQASHKLTLRLQDSEAVITVDKASEVNTLIHAYALTVHKAQGSEWRKVFAIFHQSHATMLQRELLYTDITRAKEELYIICEPETFTKGIKSQRIKGNTLAEKAEWFKGKVEDKLNYDDLRG